MTLPNLPTTITATNTAWLTIATPIIKAMFAVEDAIHPVTTARLADPKGYVAYAKRSPESHAWAEAQSIVERAVEELAKMLDGIRDNALCDAYVNVDYDAPEADIEAGEAFNEDLARGVISIDAAVKMIGDEQ